MTDIHILRAAVADEGKKLSLAEMRKRMPPCPICGKKAYLEHIIADGFDFGYDAGCPTFCLDDGVHGISEPYDPEAPHINSWSAELAFNGWLEYCEKKKRSADDDRTDN